MTTSVISATNAVKEYRSGERTLRALKGISLEIKPGEFVAIVGPSGSGKSTLLNLLGLLDEPTSGCVYVKGTDIAELSTREQTEIRRETVGFVFQDFHLLPTLTARENVAVPGMVAERPDTSMQAEALLRQVGLEDRLEHYPNELSGGQKQRVAIARSMINQPDILLADEPTGNLDQETGKQVLDLFTQFTAEGVAVVTVTHDQQVESIADRTVELVDGVLDPENA
jgi:putative ABC transport system ATP-binding protein